MLAITGDFYGWIFIVNLDFSSAISYLTFTFGNFISAPIVGVLGPKWALVCASIICTISVAMFLIVTEALFYVAATLLGIGSAILWTAQGKYIAMNSTRETASMHSVLFWCVYQFWWESTHISWLPFDFSAVAAGIFLYFAFRTLENNNRIEDSRITVIYITFTCILVVATVTMGLLRGPSKSVSFANSEAKSNTLTIAIDLVLSTFRLLFSKQMLFLSITFIYTGLELSFTTGVYVVSIAFTNKLASNTKTLVAFDAIALGFGHITGEEFIIIYEIKTLPKSISLKIHHGLGFSQINKRR